MGYGVVVQTLGQFLRRVAIDGLRYGYFRYALRQIPDYKDPLLVDHKLISLYGVTQCRMTRMRRRRKGLANVLYVRLDRFFVLMASEGQHPVFEQVRSYDFRTAPLHFRGYAIGFHQGKPCITVGRDEWQPVEQRFSKIGLRAKVEVERKLNALPYCRFPGVVRQQWKLVRQINARRKQAGLEQISFQFPQKRVKRGG
jgi:hypothetical protein